jgi:hypothetical protein
LDIFSKSSSILASLELELQNLIGLLVACRFLLRRPPINCGMALKGR